MKLETKKNNILRSGNMPEHTFKIAANSKAFEILSDKLYTDAKLAIVRELSTNAYDAQVDAGTQDRPFDVHLPNAFTSYFSIRDYGTGMSPEEVEDVYTTYFASTRDESDDFTGALGLGSKSPFAYVDSFTVTSYRNGVAYTYSAFKNEHGEPSIALLDESSTTEENGVKVHINVEASDVYSFKHAAEKVYRFFPVFPNVTGQKIEKQKFDVAFSGERYAIFANTAYNVGLNSQINVVMGNVCYAVDAHRFQTSMNHSSCLVIYADIGECQMAASREELRYDDKTVANIQQRIDDIMTVVKKEIKDKIDKNASKLANAQAMLQFGKIVTMEAEIPEIFTSVDNAYSMRRLDKRGSKLRILDTGYHRTLHPRHDTKYLFILDDTNGLKQKHKNSIKHYMDSGCKASYYLVTIEDEAVFKENIGEIEIKVSELPSPPRKIATINAENRSFIKQLGNVYNRKYMAQCWHNVHDVTNAKGVLAVERSGYNVILNGKTYDPYDLYQIATALGYNKIYGIAKKHIKRFSSELELVSFDEAVKKKLEEIVAKMTKHELARDQFSCDDEYSPQILDWINGLSDTCSDFVAVTRSQPLNFHVRRAIGIYGVSMPQATDFVKEFYQTYPLMSSINTVHVQEQDVTEYINLKENSKHVAL